MKARRRALRSLVKKHVHGRLQAYRRSIACNGLISWDVEVRIWKSATKEVYESLRSSLEDLMVSFERERNVHVTKSNMEFHIVFKKSSDVISMFRSIYQ